MIILHIIHWKYLYFTNNPRYFVTTDLGYCDYTDYPHHIEEQDERAQFTVVNVHF